MVPERQPSASSGNLLEMKVSQAFSDLLNQVLWAPGGSGGGGGGAQGAENLRFMTPPIDSGAI